MGWLLYDNGLRHERVNLLKVVEWLKDYDREILVINKRVVSQTPNSGNISQEVINGSKDNKVGFESNYFLNPKTKIARSSIMVHLQTIF